jgi:serine/threonine-protein kinase HipA
MIKLDVWLTLPAGVVVKAGMLAVSDPDFRGALQGQFRYDPEYLAAPDAFPLDPLHLPLAAKIFDADRPHSGVHGVFEDSLPDDWGRRIMARRFHLGRTEQRVPHLLQLLGDQGLGALIYADKGKPMLMAPGVSCRHLEELAILAGKFEADPMSVADDELSILFQAGSSPGGARPKALVYDENGAYLAKFASTRDHLDVVGLEAAAMDLARQAGIKTAETSLLMLGSRKCLLVKRFDVNPAGGRNHLISMQTLLATDGYYNAGYRELAEKLRHISAVPQADLRMLYRQMVFNVMVGNTDDHLKNFFMLHGERGWALSPAFDLTPNIGSNQEHVLRIGLDFRVPDLKTILAEAPYFGIKRQQQAMDVVAEIHEVVSQWKSAFNRTGVPEKDARAIGADIVQRLKKSDPGV